MVFRRVFVLVCCMLTVVSISAQAINLEPLNKDVKTLFASLGQDISPAINALARSGDNLVGAAELSGKKGFYFSFFGLNVTSMDGIGEALGTSDAETWKFQLVPIPSLIAAGAGGDAAGFSTLTQRAFALPSMRLGFGLPLPGGFEVLANGVFLPSSLVTLGAGLAGKATADKLKNIEASLNLFTLGGTVRKVLISEKANAKLPALSMGLGYTYSQFGFGAKKFSLEAFGIAAPDVGGLGPLSMAGAADISVKVHSAGISLGISKTMLSFFRPFFKSTASFYHSEYDSTLEATATVTPTNTAVAPITQALVAPIKIVRDDMGFFASTGFELVFPGFITTLAVTVDMERPVLLFKDFTINGIGLLMGMRLQF